ncbi:MULTISPECIES: hydroxymethylbilane synthase [unclassified Sphingomonas]|uniref:hydroxymethylbilane synthase n=1 Tax=unclassified Sphingomonas TaxID=196159 RepID=UPI0006F31C4E|nr:MULTISPECIES: hydroxymethylbilane synthase [unclassified Sphingomonas]KQX17916.1 porphobilinogen deaminase [Sphingomonas sp. Root1294]KQY70841.1 porphobilinogen deaminase [Sphingomonas sp. Root50]KRB91664.1 porphobilinogen deaminase [Sphingomonas sp. Root720]
MTVSLSRPLRLGTRGSPLALTQARMVIAALRAAHGWDEDAVEIVAIKTSGDRIQDRALADVGGKALWTKELDRALIDGEIDFAVHSMKDVETIRPAEIVIAAMLPRADVRDRLIGAASLAALPPGARVGTSSPRRSAQVRRARPDAAIVLFRGNVDTRLGKLAAGEAEATLLAGAGLLRLGRDEVGHPVPVEEMLPAPAQGAVGIETLATREDIRALLGAIDDGQTNACVSAERALLAALGADCRSPVGALAVRSGAGLLLRAEILTEDGSECRAGEALLLRTGDAAALAHRLLESASPRLRALFAGA